MPRARAGGPHGRHGGFTLLELVVAITLMGLVLVVLYSGLRLGLSSADSGEARAAAANRQRLVQEFLRRQLAQSVTVYAVNDRQERVTVFTGQAGLIEFVGPMLAHLGQAGLYRIRVGETEGRLWLRWRPYLTADPNAGEERETVLLDGVSGLEWAYFGAERDEDPRPQWRSAWASLTRRPALVRLNLIVGGETWPDLVVALSEGPP